MEIGKKNSTSGMSQLPASVEFRHLRRASRVEEGRVGDRQPKLLGRQPFQLGGVG